jgi:hypothetical protein
MNFCGSPTSLTCTVNEVGDMRICCSVVGTPFTKYPLACTRTIVTRGSSGNVPLLGIHGPSPVTGARVLDARIGVVVDDAAVHGDGVYPAAYHFGYRE